MPEDPVSVGVEGQKQAEMLRETLDQQEVAVGVLLLAEGGFVSFAKVIGPVIATVFRPPWAYCGQTNIRLRSRGQSPPSADINARWGD